MRILTIVLMMVLCTADVLAAVESVGTDPACDGENLRWIGGVF